MKIQVLKYCAAILIAALSLPALFAKAQSNGWLAYADSLAGYTFEYPAGAHLSAGRDASQGYDTVFVALGGSGEAYQGYTVAVFDNAADLPLTQYLIDRRGFSAFAGQNVIVGGAEALRATRHTSLAGVEADAYWIKADRVVIEIGLYAGSDGSIEPTPEARAAFDHAVASFRLSPRVPATMTPTPAAAPIVSAPAVAFQFQSPYGVISTTTAYSEQWNVPTDDTRYGVRNLGLLGRKCYGVAWNRMLHSGIDLYRGDGQDASGTTVVAVADGQVAYFDPTYSSYPGYVVIVSHVLSNTSTLYSMYAHLASVSVTQGQSVARGQPIGTILYQSGDSHLHFEMRRFFDGSSIYPSYTSCHSGVYGIGYTYLIHPDDFPAPGAGYVNPDAFIQANGGPALTPYGLPDPYLPLATLQAVSTDVFTNVQPIGAGHVAESDLPISSTKTGPINGVASNRLIVAPIQSLIPAETLSSSQSPSSTLTYTVYMPLIMRSFPRLQPACVEGQALLTNDGFEGGTASAPWVQVRNGTSDLIENHLPYAGAYSLWLGGRSNADEEALQAFTIPYYTDALTLTFKRYVTTQETDTVVYDHYELVIENNVGNEITPQISFSNLSPNRDAWSAESAVFSGFQPWGNRRVRLSIKGMTDNTLDTSLFVDDVSLQTHCAP